MIFKDLEVYSISMLHTFLSCRRKFKYRTVDMLVPQGKSKAMSFGSTIHEGIAEWYKTHDLGKVCASMERKGTEYELELSNETDPKHSIERARNILLQYADHYKERDLHVKYVEMPFVVEVPGLNDTKPFLFAGTIDGLAEMVGDEEPKLYLLESKTTTRLSSNYVMSFKPNNQITAYCWALSKYLEKPLYGAVINIIHILTKETNFLRHVTTREPWELIAWEHELQTIVEDVRRAREYESWYQNTSQCNIYGSCPYQTLCNTPPALMDNFMSTGYETRIPDDLRWLFDDHDMKQTPLKENKYVI